MAISTTAALVMMAAAAAAQAANQRRMLNKQDAAAAAGIREQSENRRKAAKKVTETIDEIGGSSAEKSRQTAGKQYLAQVQRSMANANAGIAQRGLSAAFDQRAGGAAAANEDFGGERAGLLARMDAPNLQRQAEGNLMGDTGMDISRIGGDVDGIAHLTGMKVNGIRKNPYVDIIAGLMSGAATSMAGSGGGGGGGVGSSAAYTPVAGGGRAVYGAAGANSGRAFA